MADRILRWFIEGEQSRIRLNIGGTYSLDADYEPTEVHLTLRTATKGDRPLKIDITDDGESIFDDKPPMLVEQTEKVWTTIPGDVMREDSVIKLNRDQVADIQPGEDLTVELYLKRS